MARTYHHGDKAKEKLFGKKWWRWFRSEPKEWRRDFKHRPRRAELKRAMSKFKQGKEVVWPLNTKPWIYYW